MFYYLYINMGLLFILMFMLYMLNMIYFLLMKMKIYLEIEIYFMNSMKNSLIVYYDYKSFMFMSVVMMISSMILFYSIEYMGGDLFKIRFMILLSLFVVSMMLMIMGQNLLMILLGWDGLGLISYCLVIYYNSWSSFNAGMLTVLSNRVGDIGMLISIGLYSMFGSWNYIFYYFCSNLLFMMMILAFVTKSAQIPFSSWLPAAMAAPTPISSLVHSSTLVTAGIYLLMRFYNYLLDKIMLMNFLLFLGIMTMFMAGIIANLENDFKKIIALSTLSQLGLMMMTLCLSFKLLSFFHLIIHALFKSLLFMCAGLILHSMIDNQDIRYMGGMNMNYFMTLMYFNCSNLALCGFPFMSGFFSKDLILEINLIFNKSFYVMLIFYMSIGLTVMYTFRLLFYMNMLYIKYSIFLKMEDNYLMNFSMMILFLFSIMGGVLISKLIFLLVIFSYISIMMKFMVNLMILFGMSCGILINYFYNNLIFKSLFYLKFISYMKKMFGVSMIFSYFSKVLNLSSNLFSFMEKGWVMFYSVLMLNMFYSDFYFYYFLNNLISVLVLMMLMIIII